MFELLEGLRRAGSIASYEVCPIDEVDRKGQRLFVWMLASQATEMNLAALAEQIAQAAACVEGDWEVAIGIPLSRQLVEGQG